MTDQENVDQEQEEEQQEQPTRNQTIRLILLGVAGVVAFLLLSTIIVYAVSGSRMSRVYSVGTDTVPKTSRDRATIKRGEHLVRAVGKCPRCHGDDLAGRVVIDDWLVGRIASANLVRPPGQVSDQHPGHGALTNADIVRAIRHGIRPEGKPLLLMPAQEFHHFSDEDLAAMISYIRSLPRVTKRHPTSRIGPFGRLLYLVGEFDLLPVEQIDHTAAREVIPEPSVSIEYGKYLVDTGGCRTCHRKNLSGGEIPFAPPGTPPAPSLTQGGHLPDWQEEDFRRVLREGKRPFGDHIDAFMPWRYAGLMTDDEIKAIWLYLRSVPIERRTATIP